MANIKIDLHMTTAYHHQTNDQTEHRIRTVCQCLRNYVNPKGTKWTRRLPHVQTAINATPGDTTRLSSFKCIFGRTIYLFPSVKVLPTAVPSADDIASQIIKKQQLTRNAPQIARARQTKSGQKRRKGPPIIPEQNEVTSDLNPVYTRLEETTNLLEHG